MESRCRAGRWSALRMAVAVSRDLPSNLWDLCCHWAHFLGEEAEAQSKK